MLLSDTNKMETEQLEIISVLVQITAPWIEDDHVIKGLICHLKPILEALTSKYTSDSDCFKLFRNGNEKLINDSNTKLINYFTKIILFQGSVWH